MNPEFFKMILASMGVVRADDTQERADSVTAFLSQQLESVESKTYDIVYPKFKAREMIPVDMSDDPGAETISYTQWDDFGAAQLLANYADDLPMVDALAEKVSANVEGLGVGYQYSVQDLRRAAMAGTPLDQMKARAARRAVDLFIERVAAQGMPGGLTGLGNNPNVGIQAPITGAWLAGPATGLQAVTDVGLLIGSAEAVNINTFEIDTLAFAPTQYNFLKRTPMTLTGDTSKTALTAIREHYPEIKNIYSWPWLETMNAAGTGPRIVAYAKDPDVLALKIPQDFEQYPPQAKNLSFVVPCHARAAGVVVRYPIAVRYMDGC